MSLEIQPALSAPVHFTITAPLGCWRDGEGGCTRGPSTLQHSAVGFPAEKLLKKLKKAISLLGKKKKKSLTVEAQEQILQLHFLRSFAGYAHRSRSSRHPLTHLTWGTTAISGAALTKPQGACQWPGPQAVSRSGCSQAIRLQRVASFRELPLCYHTQPDYQSWTQGSKEKIEELTPPTPLWTWNRKRGQLGRHTPGQGAPAPSLSPLLKN